MLVEILSGIAYKKYIPGFEFFSSFIKSCKSLSTKDVEIMQYL